MEGRINGTDGLKYSVMILFLRVLVHLFYFACKFCLICFRHLKAKITIKAKKLEFSSICDDAIHIR